MSTKVMILAQFNHGYYIRGTLKWLADVFAQLHAWWICTRNICPHCLGGEEMPTKVMILAQFGHGYYIHGSLKRLMGVLAWLMAWWIRTRNPCHCCLAREEMSAKVVILAQFDHGYYIRDTLKWLTGALPWPKAWWIRLSVKQVTDQKYMSPLPQRRGNAHKSHDFGSIWPWILYPWDFEEVDGCFGLAHGLVYPYSKSMPLLPRREEMPAKVIILAQFDHRYYIHRILKRLTDVVDWLKARWICTRNPCHCCLAREEMSAKVVILAQFAHGYYIRETLKWLADVFARFKAWWIRMFWLGSELGGSLYYILETLKWLTGVLAWLKAWWIHFDHGYYIRGSLTRLTDVFAWLKAWWIRLSVEQVTDQKSMSPLPRRRGNAHKSHDLGSVWPLILYPWDFEEADSGEEMPTKVMILAQFDHEYYIRGTLKWLTGVLACLRAWWICTRNPCPSCLVGEEMPAKVVILAQFEHGYYIRETLKRLTDVLAWLKAWWICVSVKQVTDQQSMPLLPRWRGKVVILAQFGHGYYIRGTSKCLTGFMDSKS
ncbi:hypothetical protein C8R44DRAFT_755367 [Mycena epipterygia]|nr:hypothetical protein C8R44DRAFT_755367 [Mycena epipterygia]